MISIRVEKIIEFKYLKRDIDIIEMKKELIIYLSLMCLYFSI